MKRETERGGRKTKIEIKRKELRERGDERERWEREGQR